MFKYLKKWLSYKNASQGTNFRERILIIDDNEVDLQFAAKVIQKKGYRVLLARDGETGSDIAKKENPDLIILDCLLPGINGKEVCQILKSDEKTKNIPIVFLTVVNSGTNMLDCYDKGAEVYLTKPITAKQLLFQIKIALEESTYSS